MTQLSNENKLGLEQKITDYLLWKDMSELREGLNCILDHLIDPELTKLRGPVDHVFIYGLDVIVNLTRIIKEN